jgi:protein-S-isoprenylcysteine O-methyltransferase Ste14
MHYIAGALLVAEFALLWILDKTIAVKGLEYVGGATWLIAMALILLPTHTLRDKGRVPRGKTFVDTKELVDTGIYALVRHPLYLGWMLMYLAIFFFRPNLILAIVGILGVICVYSFTRQEDEKLMSKFGDCYRRYMQTVPRFNLVASLIRRLRDRQRS